MKKWNKVLALILALAVAVSNLPPVLVSAATRAGAGRQTQSADTDTGMRLRQTDFDSETGILTMSLEVKTSEVGKVTDYVNHKEYEGRFLNEAYLAFQVDPQSVVPITADGTVINAGSGKIGFVGLADSVINSTSATTNNNIAIWKKFVNGNTGMGRRYGSGFNAAMGTAKGSSNPFNENYSGYFTSYNRPQSGMMDCYLHLRWNDGYTGFEEAVDENGDSLNDGYVKAIDLYFQCYSGDVDDNGNRIPAKSESALFANSIRIPCLVSAESPAASVEMSEQQIRELINQFYMIKSDSLAEDEPQIYFAAGAAGFREATRARYTGDVEALRDLYAYGITPVQNSWLNGVNRDYSVEGYSSAELADPVASYTNMNKEYIVTGFEAYVENGSEFNVPSGITQYPQYDVPFHQNMDDLKSAEKLQGYWAARAHYLDTDTYVPLKFHLTTQVSENSASKPELDAVEDNSLNDFLKCINWEFALKETDDAELRLLNDFYEKDLLSFTDPETGEETEKEFITTNSYPLPKTYQVQEAYINDPSSNYNGSKVQVVQEVTDSTDEQNTDEQESEEDDETEVQVTPVGVMLDFSEKTKVTYKTLEEQEESDDYKTSEETDGYAPQLRISSDAGDANSYLWPESTNTETGGRKGMIYLKVSYQEPNGGVFTSAGAVTVKLHRDDKLSPSYTTIEMDEAYRDKTTDDETAYTLDVKKADPTLNGVGIKIVATMYDQYGGKMLNSDSTLKAPDLKITPPENVTKEKNALSARYSDEEGAYYLIYKSENNKFYDANDLLAGTYKIEAIYTDELTNTSVPDVGAITLTVTKDPNEFAYFKTDLTLTSKSPTLTNASGLRYDTKTAGELTEIYLTVPPKTVDSNGVASAQTAQAEFNPTEIANQWRDPDRDPPQTAGSAYDVIPGLRNPDGSYNEAKLLENFTFTYEWEDKNGKQDTVTGLDMSALETRGIFTFDSTAGYGTHRDSTVGANDAEVGSPIYITVTATYKGGEEGVPQVQKNRYCIYFVRENRMLTTIKGSYNNSTAGKQIDVKLGVPEAGNTTMATLKFSAYDQYDDLMDWSTLQDGEGNTWTMAYDKESLVDAKGNRMSELKGITLGGANNATIALTDKAQACSFNLYASYGGITTADGTTNNGLSQKITVTVTKAEPVPTKIQTITSHSITIQVPNKNATGANIDGPSIVVLDQYGDVMDSKDYIAKWSCKKAGTSKEISDLDPLVSLDKSTGKVTVKPCAQTWDDIVMEVQIYKTDNTWVSSITQNTKYTQLQIKRNENPEVTNLTVENKVLNYPLLKDSTRTTKLTATADTEYGEAEDTAEEGAVQWILQGVTYYDESTVTLQNGINYSSSDMLYADENNTVMLNRSTGVVTFLSTAINLNKAPTKLKVMCDYHGKDVTVEIPVKYSGLSITSITRQPTEIKFLAGMSDEIQIPMVSDESDYERELKAQVHDQFGFVMKAEDGDNVPCTWRLAEQKKGVNLSGNTLKIAKGQADAGTVTVNVSYTANNVTATNVLEIGMYRTKSEPTTMEPLSVGETEITNNAVTLAMPTFTGPRAEDAVAASYTLKARVLDGYKVHLTSRTIKWKVVTDQYNIATITGNNKLTLKNTDAWVDVGSPDEVQIVLEAYDSAALTVTQTVTITLKKEAIYAAYAQPELKKVTDENRVSWPKYSQRTGYTDCLQIPSIDDYTDNGNQPYKAYFTSTVYSQYRTEISDTTAWPVDYDICHPNTESNSITGLTIEKNGLNGAVLKIGTNVDITLSNIWIVAKPTNDKATLVNSVNNCNVKFDAGISYSAGLALGSDYYAQDEAEQDKNVPTWEPGSDKNIPTTEETYVRYELNAFVHDQRGANYSTVGGGSAYPVWQLGENAPEGVTFTNPTNDSTYGNSFDTDGNVKGETVYLWVSSRAIANGATTLDVPVKVWANGKADGGEAFVKEITLTLTRGNPTATYLYFNNAKDTDTDGAGLGDSIARPTAGESAKVVDISGIVYDAYGIPYSGAEMNITVMGANLPSDVEVVDVTGTAAKAADKDATEAPLPLLSQKIMRGETLLAELVMGANGKATLSVYGTCDLANIELELECEGISGSKILRLPITQQTRTAKTITLSQLDDEEDEPEAIEDGKAEVIIEKNAEGYQLVRFFAEMIDQYSESYTDTAGTFEFKWSVLTEGDIEGTWVDYKETDGDGNEPETAKKFLQYDSTNGALSLMINPDNYQSKLSLKVKCELVQKSNNMSVTSDEFELTLRRRSSNSNSSAFGAYTVTYLAGDHGTITSIITSELVLEGTSPKLIPTVAAEKGYALRGWMNGGELISDPGTMKIYNDVTLVAQYIVLDDYKFVSGYSDGTVRTEQNVTRGEFIRMLVGAATSYKPGPNNQYANVFSDVEEDAYYRDYAAYAYFYGIVSGYEDGTFRPDDPITRAEAASMIAKAKGITPNAGEKVFKDLNPDAWYTGYAEALGREGILSGYEDGTFRPENNLTRAEAITMLVRISDGAPSEREADNLRKTADMPFKDVDRKHWAFPYVVRAAGVA